MGKLGCAWVDAWVGAWWCMVGVGELEPDHWGSPGLFMSPVSSVFGTAEPVKLPFNSKAFSPDSRSSLLFGNLTWTRK